MKTATLPDVAAIRRGLGDELSDWVDVHVFDRLDSTSQWLREQRPRLLQRLESGRIQLCVTDWQQAGVGRRGKQWQTQPGNVTFSLLSRVNAPAAQLLGLSLVTGIAVAEELDSRLGLGTMLKWPNDIIYKDRKLGGLLTEFVTGNSQDSLDSAGLDMTLRSKGEGAGRVFTDVITGIGVNINHDDSVLGLGIGATSIKQAGIDLSQHDRDALVGCLCGNVARSHVRFVNERWTPFGEAWAKRDWLQGKEVSIHHAESVEHAVACGVNEEGARLVKSEGTLKSLYGGNVSIRPTV